MLANAGLSRSARPPARDGAVGCESFSVRACTGSAARDALIARLEAVDRQALTSARDDASLVPYLLACLDAATDDLGALYTIATTGPFEAYQALGAATPARAVLIDALTRAHGSPRARSTDRATSTRP
jgi:hypothetical protein